MAITPTSISSLTNRLLYGCSLSFVEVYGAECVCEVQREIASRGMWHLWLSSARISFDIHKGVEWRSAVISKSV